VVVTGMLAGTMFTHFVLPTIYSLVTRDHHKPAVANHGAGLEAKEPVYA